MVLISDMATEEREFVFGRECLPRRIVYHRSRITVGTWHENDYCSKCVIDLRTPKPELGYRVIHARLGGFI